MKVAVPKRRNWLLSMNYQNSREVKLSRAGPDYTREAPGIVYEGLIIKPISCMCGGTPDLSNRVRGLDDLSSFLVGEAILFAAVKAAASSSARNKRSVFPLTVMMPCGPGILSLRKA